MAPRRTQAKSLRRNVASRPERKTVVIFCEGEKSEPDYIKGVKELPGVKRKTSINIEIDPEQGVPLTLVKRAIDRFADDEVDECWCVFDVEWPKHHPNLREAIELAQNNGIKLAISNPCFEVWLIFHWQDQTAFMTTGKAESASRKLDGRGGKAIDAAEYMSRRKAAVRRAVSQRRRHDQDGTCFPHDNPSSTMYELLAAIEP